MRRIALTTLKLVLSLTTLPIIFIGTPVHADDGTPAIFQPSDSRYSDHDAYEERISRRRDRQTQASPRARKSSRRGPRVSPQTTSESNTRRVVRGSLRYVVCTKETGLRVRDESLEDVIFEAKRFEQVTVFQGWGLISQDGYLDGRKVPFVKVQFPARVDEAHHGIGWVAKNLIRLVADCPQASGLKPNPEDQPISKPPTDPVTPPVTPVDPDEEDVLPPGAPEPARGLSDPACCNFPLDQRPTASYQNGMRRFGAGRSRGSRLHAACDLYRKRNDPTEAVASGLVIRDLYYFYQGTFALEVRHSGGFVVRYGEVTGRQARNIYGGSKVKAGQTIGFIGKVNSNCCEPMLHFELYGGTRRGSLSSGGNAYQRRSDLINPTKHLAEWERRKFDR